MTIGQLAFVALVWGSVASVLLVFAYLLAIVFRELRETGNSSAAGQEVEP